MGGHSPQQVGFFQAVVAARAVGEELPGAEYFCACQRVAAVFGHECFDGSESRGDSGRHRLPPGGWNGGQIELAVTLDAYSRKSIAQRSLFASGLAQQLEHEINVLEAALVELRPLNPFRE